jgi:hypothetical protein
VPVVDTEVVSYFAVGIVDEQTANRFLSMTTTPLVSGRKLNFFFKPGDNSVKAV